MSKKSRYYVQETWLEAVQETEFDLIPIAMKLIPLEYEIDFIPDPDYSAEFILTETKIPTIAITVTTVFDDTKYNGKWGFCMLPTDNREQLAAIVLHEEYNGNEHEGRWVFFSQKWVTE